MLHAAALLTAEQSRAADSAAIASGIAAATLMERAGQAVADVICTHYTPCPVLVACGPGNNGGDGQVIARLLQERGWEAKAVSVSNFTPAMLQGMNIVVDALFGTGLSRPIEDAARDAIAAINASGLPVIAVDMPSGIDSDSGAVMSIAIRAAHTVTFVRAKPGQFLLPGKAYAGEVHVAEIGISGDALMPTHFLNGPDLWRSSFPFPHFESHKYTRGHALVIGGGKTATGAARLAAMGALRSGSGLVSVACTSDALPIYAASLTAIMTRLIDSPAQLEALLDDKRFTAAMIGPGCGVHEHTRQQVLQILSHGMPCVLDADALSVFSSNLTSLFGAITGPVVMTPHEGEFSRLFHHTGAKTQRALQAAQHSQAVIVLKGNDTVIAAPDGRIAINASAPPWLATAGAGDVLAGMIAGLLAQGMPAFEAACAAVWLHGEAATHFGPGLIAEDLPDILPEALQELFYG